MFLSPWARDTSSKDGARKSPHSQIVNTSCRCWGPRSAPPCIWKESQGSEGSAPTPQAPSPNSSPTNWRKLIRTHSGHPEVSCGLTPDQSQPPSSKVKNPKTQGDKSLPGSQHHSPGHVPFPQLFCMEYLSYIVSEQLEITVSNHMSSARDSRAVHLTLIHMSHANLIVSAALDSDAYPPSDTCGSW